jgi:esterase/lipase superfamily enzyme
MSIDLKFKGAPIAFSWPLEHEGIFSLPENYGTDSRRVQMGANDLAMILPLVRSRSDAVQFDVIAHSIGSNLTAQSILQARAELCEHGASFDNVVFGAPDIFPELLAQQSPALLCSARRLTIYYSHHDKALLASMILQQGRRIGRGSPPIRGANSIDAGEIDPTFIGHSYLFSRSVLHEVFTLIHSGMPAKDRLGVEEDAYTGGFRLSEVKK